MRDICIDVARQPGCAPSGQQASVTVIDLEGLGVYSARENLGY